MKRTTIAVAAATAAFFIAPNLAHAETNTHTTTITTLLQTVTQTINDTPGYTNQPRYAAQNDPETVDKTPNTHKTITKHQTRTARLAAQSKQRAKAARIALAQLGDTYTAGGEGPNNFDCSGLALYAWKKAAGVNLTHYSHAQWKETKHIKLKNAEPGDLVFYLNGASHVGVYIGDGKIVHASDYGIGVVKGTVKGTPWTNAHYTGIGRVKTK